MKDYRLSAKAIVMIAGSSQGTQPKYYDKGYWYKEDYSGYEGKAEYLSSLVLSCSNITDYVSYDECMINGKRGCRSKNFLDENSSFITFHRLYDMYRGGSLSEQIILMDRIEERISFVKEFILDYTGFDCSAYLSKILSLDMLLLNIDRHFNNLGIIINSETDECREAPIFDNGASLFSNYSRFPMENSLEENLDLAYALPFSSNFEMQANAAGIALKLDYDKLIPLLEKEPASRALDILNFQLEKYRKLLAR